MLSRREFIKACVSMAAGLSMPSFCRSLVAEAAGDLGTKSPVIYLEANTCTGNLISLLNARDPDLSRFLREDINLYFQQTLMVAEGEMAINAMYKAAEDNWGKYILIVEGSIATREDGLYGIIGEMPEGPLTSLQAVRDLAPGAKYIVPFGVCACYGGHYTTPPNPSGMKGVPELLDRKDQKKVVNVPGCPGHPDWLIGTLTHLMVYGVPDLDPHGRPKVFFGRTVHDLCSRRSLFEQGIFASRPGESGCLYKIGCKGPVAGCDVPLRQWNTYYHWQWPIGCNVPCIACTEPGYPVDMMPFYKHLPDVAVFGTHTASSTIAKVVGAGTGLGIAGHLGASLITGRVQKNYQQLDQPLPPLPPEPTPSPDLPSQDYIHEMGEITNEPDLPNDNIQDTHIFRKPRKLVEPKQAPPDQEEPESRSSRLAKEIAKKWKD